MRMRLKAEVANSRGTGKQDHCDWSTSFTPPTTMTHCLFCKMAWWMAFGSRKIYGEVFPYDLSEYRYLQLVFCPLIILSIEITSNLAIVIKQTRKKKK